MASCLLTGKMHTGIVSFMPTFFNFEASAVQIQEVFKKMLLC